MKLLAEERKKKKNNNNKKWSKHNTSPKLHLGDIINCSFLNMITRDSKNIIEIYYFFQITKTNVLPVTLTLSI
jgi:hypothetical protein